MANFVNPFRSLYVFSAVTEELQEAAADDDKLLFEGEDETGKPPTEEELVGVLVPTPSGLLALRGQVDLVVYPEAERPGYWHCWVKLDRK